MTVHRCTCPGCQARREEQARLSAAEAEAARDQAAVDAAVATCPTCAGDQECVKHETWRCATCKRRLSWCFGAADDRPDDCDACWGAAHSNHDAAPAARNVAEAYAP